VGVVNDCYMYTAHAQKCDTHVTTVTLYRHKYMTCGNKEGGHFNWLHTNGQSQWSNY